MKNYQLLLKKEDNILKSKLNKYSTTVLHEVNAINYLKTIDIKEFLELDYDTFKVTHLPYATHGQIFYIHETGTYYFEMYGNDGKVKYRGDLIELVAKLRGTNYFKAIHYVIDLCDIKLNASDKIKRLHLEMEVLINFLTSNELKQTYPDVYKVLCTGRVKYNKDIAMLLTILKNNVIDTEDGIRLISQLSARQLSEQLYGKVNPHKVTKLINLVTYLGMIDKIPTDSLPSYVKNKVLNYQKERGYKYRTNVIEFKELNDDFFHLLNKRCEVIVSNNLNIKAFLTREGLYFSLCKSEADRVFNQDKFKPIGEETNEYINTLVSYTMCEISSKGYVLEKDIKKFLSTINGKETTHYKFNKYKQYLIKEFNLQSVYLNTDYKSQLNINHMFSKNQSPKALIRNLSQ